MPPSMVGVTIMTPWDPGGCTSGKSPYLSVRDGERQHPQHVHPRVELWTMLPWQPQMAGQPTDIRYFRVLPPLVVRAQAALGPLLLQYCMLVHTQY